MVIETLTERQMKLIVLAVDFVKTNCDADVEKYLYESVAEGEEWNVPDELHLALAALQKAFGTTMYRI